MITRLRLQNFKNFADAELTLGKFTVILGTNASGKSNIRDAFRFLHGIGRGYSISEIIGGKRGNGGQLEWAPMRGAMKAIVRLQASDPVASFELNLCEDGNSYKYGIEFLSWNEGQFTDTKKEYLFHEEENVFNFENPYPSENLYDDLPMLTVKEKENIAAANVFKSLSSIRFHEIDPNSAKLGSPPGQKGLGDRGENLPTVLQAICADPARKETLMEWVRALTPMDVVDFKFYNDLNGFVQLYLVESDGAEISAVSASDGTLRFLALLAALLGPNPAKLYFFEEIESGIHPARLHLLIDMLERQTAKSGIQVVTTTHSPELLSLLSDETLKSTSIVYRPPGRSDAIIKPVLEFPNIEELRQHPGLGHLHATGWFERALSMMDGKQAAE